MSEPTPSGFKGDFSVLKRDNDTGGNLTVEGDITCDGYLTGIFPTATISTPGVIKVGAGLNISDGVVSWKGVYRYKGGETLKQGGGAYICVDDNTLVIDDSDSEFCIAVNLKANGGIISDQSGDGLQIDAATVKTILGLKGGAYKDIASNTGTSVDADKIPALGSGGVLNYAVIPTDYVRNAELTLTLAGYVTLAALNSTLSSYVQTSTLGDYVTASGLEDTLADYVTIDALTTALSSYVTTTALTATLASYATSASVTSEITSALEYYSLENHQHTVTPVYSVPDSGIIALERDKTQYTKTIEGNTVIGFDATGLGLSAGDSATFELLLKMGTYVYPVLFGSNISWLNGEEPYFTEANKSYLFAFRTYNGGESWVGAYQGQF